MMINPFTQLVLASSEHVNAPAVIDGRGTVSYGKLVTMAKQAAQKLRQIGIRPGQLVVTCLPPTIDWILTQAVFHEAAISCSNHGHNALEATLGVDWVLSKKPVAGVVAEKTIIIDDAWLNDLKHLDGKVEPISYHNEDSICRLILTSGTTGDNKAVPIPYKVHMARVRKGLDYWSTPESQINLMPLSTIGGYFTAFASLLLGKACYFSESNPQAIALIQRDKIKSLIGSPLQLADILKPMQANPALFESLTDIRSAGGFVSDAMYQLIQSHLKVNVCSVYGSTEMGGICLQTLATRGDAFEAGNPLPNVEIQIVDAANKVVPAGQEGQVRIKTDTMVQGYYKNEAATKASFKKGWFYPGDKGHISEKGQLILAGRDSDVVNCGGVKINLVTLDEYVMTYPGVEDVASFTLTNDLGMDALALSMVVAKDFDMKTFQQTMLKYFGPSLCPTKIFVGNVYPATTWVR